MHKGEFSLEIIEIEINPASQGAMWYIVGKNLNVNVSEKVNGQVPVVTSIDVGVSKETRNSLITINVAGEPYCMYENVPYAVFYKIPTN